MSAPVMNLTKNSRGLKSSKKQNSRRANPSGTKGVRQSVLSSHPESGVSRVLTNTFNPGVTKATFLGRLRYGVAGLSFIASTAQAATYVFSANGLFDPNITGGGLQPAGFAQLMLSYEHYAVVHSVMRISVTNNSTFAVLFSVSLSADVAGTTDPNNVLELPYSKRVTLMPQSVYGSSDEIEMPCNVSQFLGQDPRTNPVSRGDVLSNPTEQVYFHLILQSTKLTTAEVYINLSIDYSAYFTEPREFSPSLSKFIMERLVAEEIAKRDDEEKKSSRPSVSWEAVPSGG